MVEKLVNTCGWLTSRCGSTSTSQAASNGGAKSSNASASATLSSLRCRRLAALQRDLREMSAALENRQLDPGELERLVPKLKSAFDRDRDDPVACGYLIDLLTTLKEHPGATNRLQTEAEELLAKAPQCTAKVPWARSWGDRQRRMVFTKLRPQPARRRKPPSRACLPLAGTPTRRVDQANACGTDPPGPISVGNHRSLAAAKAAPAKQIVLGS